ncbi:MAG: hypothetical protein M3O71_31560 [Bacteroidota bacterium]|nr:hypothetical protein [Bacteroidota bacterium]
MANYLTEFKDFLVEQARIHEVNPVLFGCLYLLSKVLIVIFVARAIKNLRAGRPILLPLVCAAIGYSLPYLYLIIAGKNIPLWIYFVIGVVYIFSGLSINRKIRNAKNEQVNDIV